MCHAPYPERAGTTAALRPVTVMPNGTLGLTSAMDGCFGLSISLERMWESISTHNCIAPGGKLAPKIFAANEGTMSSFSETFEKGPFLELSQLYTQLPI